jgi:pyruvate dehydrogenase E2 component (dihydrolipoamide acetyltransferase)
MATGTAVDVVMPQMGVSVSEGTITRWAKGVGEEIQADETLLEISTDKVDTEVPSPATGVVSEILVQEGETVTVGTVLARIGGEVGAAPSAPAPPEPATQPAAEAADEPSSSEGDAQAPSLPPTQPQAPEQPAPPQAAPSASEPVENGPSGNGRTFVSPVVARIAGENGIDPAQVPGTGRGGRVTKKDILDFIESGAAKAAPAPQAAPTPASVPTASDTVSRGAPAPAAAPRPLAGGEAEESLSAMRRGIAEHMRRSLDTSAHVTSAIEVDMSRVVAARAKLKAEYQKAYGVNPTYLAFVAKAAAETIKSYPWINGELRGDKIVTRNYVNIGFAVELADGKGLIVPVVRNVEGMNLLGVARAIADVAQRARSKQLTPDDVQGGTFTITNPGGYGTFHGTPVISQPQAAILGTYALVKRAWVVQDEHDQDVIAIRPIMNITLTYDHRLIDGALAGRFLQELRQRLEGWSDTDA